MLTSKQRAYLRGLANELDPIFQIGKNGLNENMAETISGALERRELIKLTILESSDVDVREASDYYCGITGAEPVQCIGRRFVMYKPSKEYKNIELPR